jgi:subtilisin-like proprotein convertase family protein
VSAPGGEAGLSGSLTCNGTACPAYYFDPAMITTDQSGCSSGYATSGTIGSPFDTGLFGNTRCNYTNGFNGTSSATPVVSGAVALLLEANPALTWRDVKAILAATVRQVDAAIAPVTRILSDGSYVVEPGWITNAAGYRFHDWYGFGAIDVDGAVAAALAWAPGTLPTLQDTGWLAGMVRGGGAIPDDSVSGALADVVVPATLQVEAVQVRLSTDHAFLGDLGIELTSPSGTRSVLLNAVNGFGANHGTVTIQLASNAFFGEASAGTWTLKVVDATGRATGRLVSWQLRIYGHRGST